jgi:hypothetical protein
MSWTPGQGLPPPTPGPPFQKQIRIKRKEKQSLKTSELLAEIICAYDSSPSPHQKRK